MIEPPPTPWAFPDPRRARGDVVAEGGDLEPGTILAAYRQGLFPMPVDGRLAWWSPDPRSVVPLDGIRVTRSLRRSCRRYEIRVDTAFAEVVAACADPRRPHGWITPEIEAAYRQLHDLGWAHSVEAWTAGPSGGRDGDGPADPARATLAGGLYGICVGGLFAGESMFHHRRDASKVALLGLIDILRADGVPRLLDVQWLTPHLASLGAVEVPREEYLRRLAGALREPPPPAFGANIRNRP